MSKSGLLLRLCLVVLMAGISWAETTTWTGSDGNWSDEGNWDNGVPDASDDAVIQTDVTAIIDGTSESAATLSLPAGTSILSIIDGGSLSAASVHFDAGNDKTISLDNGFFEDSQTAAHNYKNITINLSNGAGFTTNGWIRCLPGGGVTITVDNSTFSGQALQPFQPGGLIDVSVCNGGSFSLTQPNFGWYNNDQTANLTIDGSGNTVSLSAIKDGGTANYSFIADAGGISEITVSGNMLFNNGVQTLKVDLTEFGAAAGQQFTLFTGSGSAASGVFETVAIDGWPEDYQIDYAGGADGRDIVLTLIASVPEASQPSPADGAIVYDTTSALSWKPGSFATSHHVYFGTDYDAVSHAQPLFFAGDLDFDSVVGIGDLEIFAGHWLADSGFDDLNDDTIRNNGDFSVMAANWLRCSPYKGNLLEAFCIPSEPRRAGKTYYWRIDETDGEEVWRGDVWSFEQKVVPQTVEELFSGFDPRADDLEVEVISDSVSGGMRQQVVRYVIDTWKGQKSYMTAYYAYPDGQTHLPAVLHLHGGGQSAFWHEVEFYANRGYAAMSINWGGKSLPDVAEAKNTDWGAINPTQEHAGRYQSLLPYPETIDTVESPRNCSWYPIILAARRALTFLEQQPEVDPARLGLYGHSMGGQLTTYVCGSGEQRLKAACPSVGGAGFRTQDDYELSGTARNVSGDLALYNATMETQSYAPRIRTPILFLGATNDFNAKMDRVFQTYGLMPADTPRRLTFTPHMNHRFTDVHAVCRALWLDQHLMGSFTFPEKPASRLSLSEPDGIPLFSVTPDDSSTIVDVDLYYSHDQHIIARFWRDVNETGNVSTDGTTWSGPCPIMDPAWYRSTSVDADQYLFAFANVTYEINGIRFAISSDIHGYTNDELQAAGVTPIDVPSSLIDNFSRGYHDWYKINEGHATLTEFWTRKLTDPKWHGSAGQKLKISVLSPAANQFKITLVQNEWRNRGAKETYEATKNVSSSPTCQDIVLALSDFTGLNQWDEIDQLGIGPAASWNLPTPIMCELKWVSN